MAVIIPIPCTGRLAAIVDSLRAVAPITLAGLYRVDPLSAKALINDLQLDPALDYRIEVAE